MVSIFDSSASGDGIIYRWGREVDCGVSETFSLFSSYNVGEMFVIFIAAPTSIEYVLTVQALTHDGDISIFSFVIRRETKIRYPA